MNKQLTEVAGYGITGHLGSGGMGEVYKGFHPALNRVAAIKVLYRKDLAERFKNEAYIQATVNHPNIARLYDYVITRDVPCIIMEYVDGQTLDCCIQKKGRLANEEAESILGQISSAISYLHRKDILHRDIKPQNFKIERDGTTKMLDFGISKNKYSPKLTQHGFVVGTTEYMAPEQFEYKAGKPSDIWSLGVMAYEMVTGYMPFEATNPIALRTKISKGKFTHPKILAPQLSYKLEMLIQKTLCVNPAQRISAEEAEELLNGKRKTQEKDKNAMMRFKSNPSLFYAACLLVTIVLVVLVRIIIKAPSEQLIIPAEISTEEKVKLNSVQINVPSVTHAFIVFPDGKQEPIPYEIRAREGEQVAFTIQAEGYEDKSVALKINSRRRSYEYNLEKKK